MTPSLLASAAIAFIDETLDTEWSHVGPQERLQILQGLEGLIKKAESRKSLAKKEHKYSEKSIRAAIAKLEASQEKIPNVVLTNKRLNQSKKTPIKIINEFLRKTFPDVSEISWTKDATAEYKGYPVRIAIIQKLTPNREGDRGTIMGIRIHFLGRTIVQEVAGKGQIRSAFILGKMNAMIEDRVESQRRRMLASLPFMDDLCRLASASELEMAQEFHLSEKGIHLDIKHMALLPDHAYRVLKTLHDIQHELISC